MSPRFACKSFCSSVVVSCVFCSGNLLHFSEYTGHLPALMIVELGLNLSWPLWPCWHLSNLYSFPFHPSGYILSNVSSFKFKYYSWDLGSLLCPRGGGGFSCALYLNEVTQDTALYPMVSYFSVFPFFVKIIAVVGIILGCLQCLCQSFSQCELFAKC